jgi:hypothetical protein
MNQQKTGFNGVSKEEKKFKATISLDGEQKHIGLLEQEMLPWRTTKQSSRINFHTCTKS